MDKECEVCRDTVEDDTGNTYTCECDEDFIIYDQTTEGVLPVEGDYGQYYVRESHGKIFVDMTNAPSYTHAVEIDRGKRVFRIVELGGA